MRFDEYIPPCPQARARALAAGWLALALYALIGAGLVVVLIVLARTPVVHDLIPWVGSFKTALVVHVDLSVLVWFMAFAGIFASLMLPEHRVRMGWLALGMAALGAVLITFSPFLGPDRPFLNNYIPVLDNPPFFAGLVAVLLGTGLMAIQALLSGTGWFSWRSPGWVVRFGIGSALLIVLISLVVGVATWFLLPTGLEHDKEFYEYLFWGAGHVLQFTHTQLLLITWLGLAALCGAGTSLLTPRLVGGLLVVGALPTLYAFVILSRYPVDTGAAQLAFSTLMRHGQGLGPLVVGGFLSWSLARSGWGASESRPERMALMFSILLYAVGGVIGFAISGINTTIPAHYHGSIVSVTMAYMGLTYHLLPQWGYKRPSLRWATWQPVLYGGGQLIHVAGLAWSGGHGIQRKTAGAEQALHSLSDQLAMGLVGLGGMISVIGGLLFLVLVIQAFRDKPVRNPLG
jgi:hypothetical protein